MKILYVAKFDGGLNEEELAIAHALTELGHEVKRIQQGEEVSDYKDCDFMLVNHFYDFKLLDKITIPRVFWAFDIIDVPKDPTLRTRNRNRRSWMKNLAPVIDLGFMSDGDWVAKDKTGKLIHFMQAADSRFTGPSMQTAKIDLLFTGRVQGGQKRVGCIAELKHRYPNMEILDKLRDRLYGRQLADKIASAKIVIAPDGPVTDLYCSNRVFLTLGFGGFLLHPRCKFLKDYYEPDKELVYYDSRQDLFEKIDYYLKSPDARRPIRQAGYARTMRDHTYIDRCRELCATVQERLF